MNDPLASTFDSPHHQRNSIAAAEGLREAIRQSLAGLFGKFTGQLSAALTSMVVKSSNPADKRTYQELSRFALAVAVHWTESFVQNVDAHLVGGALSEREALADKAAAGADDYSITLATVELRAEARYQKLVMELDARVNRLRLMIYMPVYTKALAPAGLCRSLLDTADALNWPSKNRRLLLEQFDSLFISGLEGLYKSLISALMQITTNAEKASTEPEPPPPPKRPKKWAHTMTPPTDQKHLDPETASMLQTFARKADGTGYTNGLLAADLLALADNRPLPGLTHDQSWIPLQRMSLAGHFLNEAITDPMLPDEMKPQHESVRYPLLKSALTDETLFTTAAHPLGTMVHELLLKAATSRITGNAEARRIADLLHELMVQFDLSPDFVRQTMHLAQPVHETQVERFFELQRLQAQQRRNFVILEAKRVVANQLEYGTLGRDIPAPGIHFLNTAWGPLLTKRLLQHGAEHALSKAGAALMDQLLDQLEAREPANPAPAEWKELTMTMGKALLAEGMSVDGVKVALTSLEEARKTPAAS